MEGHFWRRNLWLNHHENMLKSVKLIDQMKEYKNVLLALCSRNQLANDQCSTPTIPITCSLAHHFKLKMKPFLAHSLSTKQFQSHIFGESQFYVVSFLSIVNTKKDKEPSHKQYTKRNINKHENWRWFAFTELGGIAQFIFCGLIGERSQIIPP